MCSCICACMCEYVCECVGQRLVLVFCSVVLYLVIWDIVSHWREFADWIDWMASKPHGSSFLQLPNSGNTDSCCYAWLFMHAKFRSTWSHNCLWWWVGELDLHLDCLAPKQIISTNKFRCCLRTALSLCSSSGFTLCKALGSWHCSPKSSIPHAIGLWQYLECPDISWHSLFVLIVLFPSLYSTFCRGTLSFDI